MKNLFLSLSLLVLLIGCSSSEKAIEALNQEVIALHDSSMAKMDLIYADIMDLKDIQKKASLDSANIDSSLIKDIDDAIGLLKEGDRAMMDWMHSYKPPQENESPDDCIERLNGLKKSILEVEVKIQTGLKNSKLILDEKK